jgi:predicted amidohydrolase
VRPPVTLSSSKGAASPARPATGPGRTARAAVFCLTAALCACGPKAAGRAETCEVAFSEQGDVRVFAVSHRMQLADAESYKTFAASYQRHVDALFPCLSRSRPNLLVFPEDAGLVAWFIGRQALAGRHADTSGDAFNGLYAHAWRASDAYRERYPGISPARAMSLALSDRAWRAMDWTFGDLAAQTKSWVITSANLPRSERRETGEDVSTFADPDGDGSAYVALGPEVFNAALVYAPDGSRVGRVDKAFLTNPEEETLDLANGSLAALDVVTFPFGKVGIAISRDAFYPPFTQRLDDLGAELVVQPEAFSGWSTEEFAGDWLPKVMLASGWTLNQKYPRVQHTVAPMLGGKLFELFFDGQPFITGKADGARAANFVGLEELPGFVSVGPWAFEDDATLPEAERRAQLRALGKRLLPGSKAKEEGQTWDGFIAADLALPNGRKGAPVAVTEDPLLGSFAVDTSADAHQRNAQVAFDVGGRFYVVWEDERTGAARIRYAISLDGGRTYLPSREVMPSARPQKKPALATIGAGVFAVAWMEGAPGSERVRAAVTKTAGGRFDTLVVESSSAAQWDPAVTFDEDSNLWLAWTDFRTGLVPQVRLVRYDPGARLASSASCAADATTLELPRTRGGQFQPALISLNGNLGVAWLDGRHGDWEVRARVARDPCAETDPAPRISLPDDTEILAGNPQWAFAPDGRMLVAWDEIRNRNGFLDVNGAQWQAGTWTSMFLSPTLVMPRSSPAPVFHDGLFKIFVQDLASNGRNTVGRMDVGDLGLLADPVRADGLGDSPLPLHRPRAAVRLTQPGGGAVAWEDARDGYSRIRVLPF